MMIVTTNTSIATPLVVDLDGTLIRSDMLVESFFALASHAPWQAVKALRTLARGRAAFKAAIAKQVSIDAASLPYNEELLAWLRNEKSRGRAIYLASASDAVYVHAVADYVGIFDGVFASDGVTNLRAEAKANSLSRAFGAKQFDYVGNEQADFAVWEQAAGVVLTNADYALQCKVQQRFPHAMMMHTPLPTRRDYWKALRPHQWLKNLLIFVPAFAAQHYDLATLATCVLAFVSFSLCASGGYIFNDLLDLPNDRQHPTKRHRPFAAGNVAVDKGIKLMLLLFAASLLLGLLLPGSFIFALVGYSALTILYSTVVKRQMLLDVMLLALLYSVRLMAGGAAVAVILSPWLLSFSMFIFLSLALIKRGAELVVRKTTDAGDPKGRDYRLTDLPILTSMAAASGYVAALTVGLYISSEKVAELYSHPERLWALPVILLFWISRILMLMHRGKMLEDPVLFAMHDRTSLICAAALGVVLLVSI